MWLQNLTQYIFLIFKLLSLSCLLVYFFGPYHVSCLLVYLFGICHVFYSQYMRWYILFICISKKTLIRLVAFAFFFLQVVVVVLYTVADGCLWWCVTTLYITLQFHSLCAFICLGLLLFELMMMALRLICLLLFATFFRNGLWVVMTS